MSIIIPFTVGILALFMLIVWAIWNNTALQTTLITVHSSKIPKAFDEFRIVQISDLHNAAFGKDNQKLLAQIKKAQPDLIVITGDLINSYHPDLDAALTFAGAACKLTPCYFVSGNHESRISSYAQFQQRLMDAGVIVLENKTAEVSKDGQTLHLIGMTDPSFTACYPTRHSRTIVSEALTSLTLPNNPYTILLAHRPDLFDTYSSFGIDLTLSGHAHGGQFRLPFIGAIFAPNQGFFPKYTSGLYTNETAQMVVSRGLGNSSFPLRICNRPELMIIELHSK